MRERSRFYNFLIRTYLLETKELKANPLDKERPFWSDTPSDSPRNHHEQAPMAVQSQPQTFVVFNGYRLDLVNFELTKNGRRIRLPRQPARVLASLAGRPGEIVTREMLQREIWDHETFGDFDHALNNCINQIRVVLNDQASTPRFIETLPKSGYRFIAKVEFESSSAKQVAKVANDNDGSANRSPKSVSFETIDLSSLPETDRHQARGRARTRSGVLIASCVAAAVFVSWMFLRAEPAPQLIGVRQLTHYGRAEYTSQMVTDGARLYFTERTGGHWDVAQVSIAGGEPTRIPTPFTNSSLFDISPDGSQLLVASFEGDEHEFPLWAVPILSGAPRRLGNIRAQSAAWSPDGQSLIYASGNDIEVANADGSNSKKIATLAGRAEFFRWSPDGQLVRFMRWDSKDVGVTLWEIHPDGSHLRTVAPEGDAPVNGWLEGECSGGWTPDGKYYFYRSSRLSGSTINVIREQGYFFGLMHRPPTKLHTDYGMAFCGVLPGRDGKQAFFVTLRELRQLVRYDAKLRQYDPYLSGVPARWVDVSPDGRSVAYASSSDGSLWRSSIDGSDRRQLSFPPDITANPKWSPDSKMIVYSEASGGAREALHMISRDGDRHEVLTESSSNNSYSDLAPAWSPGGDAIVFERFQAGSGRIGTFSLDLKTRQLSKVDVPADWDWMRWSPNGRYAYAASYSSHSANPSQRASLHLFDRTTNKWTTVADAAFLNLVGWSPDSKYIYYQDMYGGETQPVFRVRASDGKVERITAPNLSFPADITAYTLIGIGPDGAPLACAIRKNSDIYSISYALP